MRLKGTTSRSRSVHPWITVTICALFEGKPLKAILGYHDHREGRDRRTDRWTDCRLKTVTPLGLGVTDMDTRATSLMWDRHLRINLFISQTSKIGQKFLHHFHRKSVQNEKLWWSWRAESSTNVWERTNICKGFSLPNVADFPRKRIGPSSFSSFCQRSPSLGYVFIFFSPLFL